MKTALRRAALGLLLCGVLAPVASVHADDERRQLRREQLREERRERQEQQQELREQRRQEVRERAREADADGDRALNRNEAQQRAPRLGKRFDDIDSNRDGVITREEVRAFRDARAKARVWSGAGEDPRD